MINAIKETNFPVRETNRDILFIGNFRRSEAWRMRHQPKVWGKSERRNPREREKPCTKWPYS